MAELQDHLAYYWELRTQNEKLWQQLLPQSQLINEMQEKKVKDKENINIHE